MKKNLFFSSCVILLSLFVISCETDQNIESTESEIVVANATYYDTSPLIYDGNNLWFGNYGGLTVWFDGPSPQSLENGMNAQWPITVPSNDPMVYEDQNAWVNGDGSGFTISKLCSGLQPLETSIIVPRLTQDDEGHYEWTDETLYINTFSGSGECYYRGKVVLNKDCDPVLVSPNSDIPSGCGEGDEIIIQPW